MINKEQFEKEVQHETVMELVLMFKQLSKDHRWARDAYEYLISITAPL